MSRHRDFRNLNLHDELDDDALSDGGEEPMTKEQEDELYNALDQVRVVIGTAQATGISDKELTDTLWHEYNDVNRTVEWALAEQDRRRAAQERKETFEYDQSALEYFRSRNIDPSEDQSRVPKIILAQQLAEQGYLPPEEEEGDEDSLLPRHYRAELSTITERSEIPTADPSPAWPRRSLGAPSTRRGADSSRTTSYGDPIEDNSQIQPFFGNMMELETEETPRQRPVSLQPSSTLDSDAVPSIRLSSATTTRASNPSDQSLVPDKPLPVTPQLSKKSKLSSLASSRSSTVSSLTAGSRDGSSVLSDSAKTFPVLRPSADSVKAPSTVAPSIPSKDYPPSIGSSAASPRTSSHATGVSEMTAQVQRAIQAALELEAIDKTVKPEIKTEKPKLTLAQPQSPPPAKGIPVRSLQPSQLPPQQIPKTAPQPPQPPLQQIPKPALQPQRSSDAPKSPLTVPSPQVPKLQTPQKLPTQLTGETKDGKPMSKLALLAQQKVSANKAPKLPAPKTEYLVPTANGPTATTAITTTYQSLFSLTDPKRPAYMPRLEVAPLPTTSQVQQPKTSKLAMKVKKAGEKPVAQVPAEEPEEATTAPLSPIFQAPPRSRAPPSAFASVLLQEDLVLFKPQRKVKERRKPGSDDQESRKPARAKRAEEVVSSLTPPSSFAFDSPSPDDVIFSARRGTSLSHSQKPKPATTSTLSSRS